MKLWRHLYRTTAWNVHRKCPQYVWQLHENKTVRLADVVLLSLLHGVVLSSLLVSASRVHFYSTPRTSSLRLSYFNFNQILDPVRSLGLSLDQILLKDSCNSYSHRWSQKTAALWTDGSLVVRPSRAFQLGNCSCNRQTYHSLLPSLSQWLRFNCSCKSIPAETLYLVAKVLRHQSWYRYWLIPM